MFFGITLEFTPFRPKNTPLLRGGPKSAGTSFLLSVGQASCEHEFFQAAIWGSQEIGYWQPVTDKVIILIILNTGIKNYIHRINDFQSKVNKLVSNEWFNHVVIINKVMFFV